MQVTPSLYKAFFEASPEIILIIRPTDGRIVEANFVACQVYGYDPGELKKLSLRDLEEESSTAKLVGTQGSRRLVHRKKDGSRLELEANLFPINLEPGNNLVCFMARDVTVQAAAERELKALSEKDPLTGLYNRRYLNERLEAMEREQVVPLTVVMLDIDGMKNINDTLGHEAGDRVLLAAASTVRAAFPPTGVIARIGGDEFVVVLPGYCEEATSPFIELLEQEVDRINREGQLPAELSISAGYAGREGWDTPAQVLLEVADRRMYRRKFLRGKGRKSDLKIALTEIMRVYGFLNEGHMQHLRERVISLSTELGLPEPEIDDIVLLAEYHDIGMVGIPEEILFKPGSLTKEEKKRIEEHCIIGYRIAAASHELQHIAEWILKHHERWDGRGYPLGLKEEEIPLACRILAVADAYEAMLRERPYRNALDHDAALRELVQCAGSQFDPEVVKAFVRITRKN
ncbi:MAG: HD domain-containing phosphohydrolase [Moorellaceae bacterium]